MSKEEIDLLLTDIGMPEMGGIELVQRVRAMYPNIPVILVSGYMDHAIVKTSPFDDETPRLQKPLTLLELAQGIRDVLDKAISQEEQTPCP